MPPKSPKHRAAKSADATRARAPTEPPRSKKGGDTRASKRVPVSKIPPPKGAAAPKLQPKRRSEPEAEDGAPKRMGVDERRAQLIVLGRRLFTEQPYDVLSIDEIARQAGISKGLLYHYFPSKRDFYVATVKDAAKQLLDTTQEVPGLSPPEQAVVRIGHYLDFVEANAGAFITLMRSGVGHDPEVAKVVDGTRDALANHILANIGVGPRPIFRLALRSWIGLVEAASLEWIDGKRVPREVVAAFLLHSLGACLESARMLDPDAPFRIGSPPRA